MQFRAIFLVGIKKNKYLCAVIGVMCIEQYIEQTILPQYDAFDGGHKRDHAQMVIDESLKLAREHGDRKSVV